MSYWWHVLTFWDQLLTTLTIGELKIVAIHSHQKKLDPFNCLFLTLMKLRLNLTEEHLAFCFANSTSTVSRYFITWICFMYHHFKEIDWYPTSEQVAGTMSNAFKEKYPTTYVTRFEKSHLPCTQYQDTLFTIKR